MEAFYSLAIHFVLDVYMKLDGKLDIDYGSEKFHSTLMMAKRYCSKTANCFGVIEETSFNFPIELRQQGMWNIHKKETISGNLHLSIII